MSSLTTPIQRIVALDGVRGIATLMVLTSHFLFADVYGQRQWWPVVQAGWIGVDLFFVLSGFLITGILLGKKGRPDYFKDFYRRRVLRIFPLYYFSVLLSALAVLLIDRQPEHLNDGYNSLGWYLAFIPNFAIAWSNTWVWQTNWIGLAHLWSLAVEEQFYILWPLIVLLLPRRALAVLCIGLVWASPHLREHTEMIFGENNLAVYVLPYCRMDGLALGSLLGILNASGWLTFKGWQKDIARDLAVSAGFVFLYILISIESHWRDTAISLMFFGVVYMALTPGTTVRRVCEKPFFRHIGQYSYAMYVFHQMFRVSFEDFLKKPLLSTGGPVWLIQIIYMVLCIAITYLLARISWRYLEERFIKMK